MNKAAMVLIGLLLGAKAFGSPGEDKMATTSSSASAQQLLERVNALSDDDLSAFRMALTEADKSEDFVTILKYANAETKTAYLSRIPKPVAQRNEQRIKDLGDVPDSRVQAAVESLATLLEPSALDLYLAQGFRQAGKNREAAVKYDAAFAAGKGRGEYYYDAGCAWARAGDRDAAFRDLNKASDAGWLDPKMLQSDEELTSLRKDPRWEKLIASIEKKSAEMLKTLPDSVVALAVVKLPTPSLDGSVSVEKALSQRRSVRQYTDAPLTLQQVSQVLWAAYGVTQPVPGVPELRGGLRTAPSAGALYPLEIYLVAGNVTDLKPGIYRYKSETHELQLIVEGDKRSELYNASASQPWVKNAPASMVYSAVYERNTRKYGDRGRERYVCMDAGHSAENVYLECTALGLGTVVLGAFFDAEVRVVVRMTKSEEPLYIVPFGKPREPR